MSQWADHSEALRGSDLWMKYPPIWSSMLHCCTAGWFIVSYIEDWTYAISLETGSARIVAHPYAFTVPLRNGRIFVVPFLHSYTVMLLNPTDANYAAN